MGKYEPRCPECGSLGERGSICHHPEPIGDHFRLSSTPVVRLREPVWKDVPYDWETEGDVGADLHWKDSLTDDDEEDEIECSCINDDPCKECLEAVINAAEWFTYYEVEEA